MRCGRSRPGRGCPTLWRSAVSVRRRASTAPLACGTPVITFGAGALAEIVDHGRTGYIVADEAEMAAAIHDAQRLDPMACRGVAEQRFSAGAMAARYVELYRGLS
jgi:glycosyltransferase involved in cell wall biosynthesis